MRFDLIEFSNIFDFMGENHERVCFVSLELTKIRICFVFDVFDRWQNSEGVRIFC